MKLCGDTLVDDLVVNPVAAGAASDWTFALHQATTRWVTLAHQDDRYRPAYTARCLAAVEDAPDSLLVFTDYSLEKVLFESISAFGTVGMSTGITYNLPPSAEWVLMVLMFTGRIGSVTVA